jgi:hypothetical protein
MKKVLMLLLSFWVLNSNGQELRGHLVKRNLCEFLDSGGYRVIKSERIYQTFTKLTQDEFYVFGEGIHIVYKLYDKEVDSSNVNDLVVHFLSDSYKKQNVIAVRMCEGFVKVGVLPMNGQKRFMEYFIKLRSSK